MNVAVGRDKFVPSSTPPQTRTVSAGGWACLAAAAVFVVYAAYASTRALLAPEQEAPLAADVTMDKLPELLKNLPASDRANLIARERAALAANRLSRGALVNLSLLYGAEGDKARSADLAIAAAKLALRDSKAQTTALQLHLQQSDFASALYRIDALIRTKPDIRDTLFAMVLSLAADKNGLESVVQLLERDPPWRQDFFLWTTTKSDKPQIAYQVVSGLKAGNAPPTKVEVQLIVGHYVRVQDFATAYYVWLDLLSETELRKAGNVYDGGFDLPLDSLYFGWTLHRTKNIETKIVSRANGSSDNVLLIDFLNNREHVIPITQFLRLAPGKYIFSGDSKADALVTDSGLVWRIACVDGPKTAIATTPLLSGTKQWDQFEVRLEVPQDCTIQHLFLGMQSGAVLDQKASGRAYYDNLRITPATVEQ